LCHARCQDARRKNQGPDKTCRENRQGGQVRVAEIAAEVVVETQTKTGRL
jgi:hypothetical protein